MDMKISGSGSIPAGEYDAIKISGSGTIQGNIKCAGMHVSGSANASGTVECTGEIHVSGACDFDKDIITKTLHVSGALNTDGKIIATDLVHLSGGMNIEGSLKCGTLESHGGLNVDEDIEAETVSVHGNLACTGLLNAESIEIDTRDGCLIGSIGGSKIVIRHKKRKFFKNLITFTFNDKQVRGIEVQQSIEGDEIDIEHVTCPRVSGRTVTVGEGCKIELLQYSEHYEIHEKPKLAKLRRSETQ
ncbi:MAG: polymer-forming cytoskeletal protein [Clostridia bacterium]|nr:polymer-forming cytoskeletal protein [Clostridia bacterium]